MSKDNAMLDLVAHGRAAIQKAQEIRAQQQAESVKMAEAAPLIVDALIENHFMSPDDRELTIRKMQKTAFAMNLFQGIANRAVPKNVVSKHSIGSAEKSAQHNNTQRESDAAWESMLF